MTTIRPDGLPLDVRLRIYLRLERERLLIEAERAWTTYNTRLGGMTRWSDTGPEHDVFIDGYITGAEAAE